jgi:hypothetical protein
MVINAPFSCEENNRTYWVELEKDIWRGNLIGKLYFCALFHHVHGNDFLKEISLHHHSPSSDTYTIVPFYLWFHFPQFQLLMINYGPKY